MKDKIWKKIYKTFRCCVQLVRLKWKKNKCLFFLDILIGLLRESKQILNMVFPAVIIQFVTDFAHMDRVLLLVFGFSSLLTGISIGIETVQRSLSNYSLRALNYLILGLNRSVMRIDLDNLEQGKTMEKYEKAYDGIWKSSEVDFFLFSVLFSKTISFAVSLYIFQTIHWSVALFVLITLLIEFVWNVRIDEKLHQKDMQLSKIRHRIQYVSDTVFECRTNKDICLNHAKGFFQKKLKAETQELLDIEETKGKELFKLDIFMSGIEYARTLIIYGFAVFRYFQGLLPIANFTLFANAVKQMTYAIWQILQSIQQIFRASEYFEDYMSYIEMGKQVDHDGESVLKEGICCIEFKNVSYKYPNQNNYAIQNVSFTITKGQTIALVGDNGAGKSTIVKLLMRLYHVTEGDILLNGKSIYSYQYEDYLSYFAPVFQDFMLYAFSVRENILFDKRKEGKEVLDLLTEIGLKERVYSLPKGLDTPYTKSFYNDGVEFSGGEEQKLVIARALAKGGEVLILDEPTAAIDPLTEYSIYKMIFMLREEYTTFFVSHRMSSTRFCDKILVFDRGELKEEGSHQELLDKEGLYYQMYSLQTQYYKGNGTNEYGRSE